MTSEPLSLEDIMLDMSRSGSPQDLDDDDIKKMLDRVSDMGLATPSDDHNTETSSLREKELADMILRLTTSIRPESSQLLSQAEIISSLIDQRNYLIKHAEEQRARWDSERDGWERTAEALIIRRTKASEATARDESLERQVVHYESDNRFLRQQLTETQTRLVILESEIHKLRPLLLMQPYYRRGRKGVDEAGPTAAGPNHRQVEEKMDQVDDPPIDGDVLPAPGPSSSKNAPPNDNGVTSPHYRQQQLPANPIASSSAASHAKIKAKYTSLIHPRIPLLTDARTEHLLMAARKIGRVRAGILAGIVDEERVQKIQREREKELRRDSQAQGMSGAVGQTMFVFMNNAPQKQRQLPVPSRAATLDAPPARAGTPQHARGSTVPAVPSRLAQSTVAPANQTQTGQIQPTALDSLVSAARSLMHTEATHGGLDVRRRSEDMDDEDGHAEFKRRKTMSGSAGLAGPSSVASPIASSSSSGRQGLARVKSALDVLADHAAGLSSKESISGPTLSGSIESATSSGNGKRQVDGSVPPIKGKKGRTQGRPSAGSSTAGGARKSASANGRRKGKEVATAPAATREDVMGMEGSVERMHFTSSFSGQGLMPSLRPVSVWGSSAGARSDGEGAAGARRGEEAGGDASSPWRRDKDGDPEGDEGDRAWQHGDGFAPQALELRTFTPSLLSPGGSPTPPTPPSPTLRPVTLTTLATPIMLSRSHSEERAEPGEKAAVTADGRAGAEGSWMPEDVCSTT